MVDEFESCLLLNTIMAARAMTRRYDEKLRDVGISVIQFSVLMVIRNHPGASITSMAQQIAMERSTLSRNLDHLTREGLVRSSGTSGRAGRTFELTKRGEEVLALVIPLWRKAQEDFRAQFGEERRRVLLAGLRQLTSG